MIDFKAFSDISFIFKRGKPMNTNKELNYRMYLQREEEFIRTDLKSEFSRYDDIKNGDVKKVKENFDEIKKNYYKGKGVLSDNPLRNNIYHLVVSAGIIARVCVDAGLPHDESYTLSDIYIRKADNAKTPEEVIDLIGELQLDYATRMNNLKKTNTISIYVSKAIDYIYDHLHEPLTMEMLANYVGLNPSYFSKLFSKETGTTVKEYIAKSKINTAKNILVNSDFALSDIALSLGFSSQSAFTSVFKKYTGTTPLKYKNSVDYKNFLNS